MIAADQPTIFPSGQIRVVMSSVDDGSMKDGVDLLTPDAQKKPNGIFVTPPLTGRSNGYFCGII
jgi:hypothetical protein